MMQTVQGFVIQAPSNISTAVPSDIIQGHVVPPPPPSAESAAIKEKRSTATATDISSGLFRTTDL